MSGLTQANVNSQALGTSSQGTSPEASSAGSIPAGSAGSFSRGVGDWCQVLQFPSGPSGSPAPFTVKPYGDDKYRIYLPDGCLKFTALDGNQFLDPYQDGGLVETSSISGMDDWYELQKSSEYHLNVKIKYGVNAGNELSYEYESRIEGSDGENNEDPDLPEKCFSYRLAMISDDKVKQHWTGGITLTMETPWTNDENCIEYVSPKDPDYDFDDLDDKDKSRPHLTLLDFRDKGAKTENVSLAEVLLDPDKLPDDDYAILVRKGKGKEAKLVYVKIIESASSSTPDSESASSGISWVPSSSGYSESVTSSAPEESSGVPPGGGGSSIPGEDEESGSQSWDEPSASGAQFSFTLKTGEKSNVKFQLDSGSESNEVTVPLDYGEVPEVTVNVYYV